MVLETGPGPAYASKANGVGRPVAHAPNGWAQEVLMRVFVRWMCCVVAVCAAIPATAGKIGFLDSEKAIRTVREGQRQLQILDDWANQRSDEFEAIQKRVADLDRDLNAQRAAASEEAISRLERDLVQAQRDLEDARRALRRDYEAQQQELLSQVATRVRLVATDYAEANGFDAVVPFDSLPLIYVADSVLITNAVIQLYNERYPID